MPTHAPSESKISSPAVSAVPCPKCGKALVDPAGLGWCSGCGYCKSFVEEPTATAIVQAATAPARVSMGKAFGGAIRGVPLWFWVLLVVIAQGIALSIVAGRDLPEGVNLPRAVWCTGQIATGFLLMFLAQCWLLLQIAPEVATLSFKDALLPFKLWPLAMKRLPKNQVCLWAAAFGATIVIGAFACVGGLDHWLTYVPSANRTYAPPAPTGPSRGAVVPVE
jgi:hypothetical protein